MIGAANFNNLIQTLSIPVLLLLEKPHIWSNTKSGVITSIQNEYLFHQYDSDQLHQYHYT